MMSYDPFWKTIAEKNISTYALINHHGILPDTIQRLRKGKPITTTTLETLCDVIRCGLNDVIEYIPDEMINAVDQSMNSRHKKRT